MTGVGRIALLCISCVFIQQSSALGQKIVCQDNGRCVIKEPMILSALDARHEYHKLDKQREEKATKHRLGTTRCPKVLVEVSEASTKDRHFVCTAAKDALEMLGNCHVLLRRPLHVQIAREVRREAGGVVFGILNTKLDKIIITDRNNILPLIKGTPYSVLSIDDFYRSLIVHEVTHGVIQQNWIWKPNTRAAYEYPAYALQIASLPPTQIAKFLSMVDINSQDEILFNDLVLAFNPFFFAAGAYLHYRKSQGKCKNLQAIIHGKASFVATIPVL